MQKCNFTCDFVWVVWSLTLREERRMKVFKKRLLRGIFGPQRGNITGNSRMYIARGFITCTLPRI
jgi:hypothetical protein